MQFKAVRLTPLLAALLLAVSTPPSLRLPWARASDVRVFWEDFSGDSLNLDEWRYQGSVSVGGGILNLTNGRLYSHRYLLYGTLEIRMRITDTSRVVQVRMQSWRHDDIYDQIALSLESWGYKTRTEDGEGWREKALSAAVDTDWHVYKIVWEPDRVLFYIDGEVKRELILKEHINHRLSRIYLKCDLDGGQLIQIDWIRYMEDYSKTRSHPSLMKAKASTNEPWLYKFLKIAWHEGNLTLQLKPEGGDFTADFDIFIPPAYRNYICEVYDDGVKITNLSFNRAERRLHFSTQVTGADPDLIEVRLVDPEPWMVQLYYTLLPLGIDIGALLKAYDKMKRRHPALPLIALTALLILMALVAWLVVRLLTGVRI